MTEVVVKSGNKKFWFAILLCLCAIGFSGYNFYFNQVTKTRLDNQLDMLSWKLQTQEASQNETIADLRHMVSTLQGDLSRLSSDKVAIVRYQLNELVSFANQLLFVYRDTTDAVRVLNYAKDILSNTNDAAFVGIKLAIAGDIVKLREVPIVDTVMLTGELNAVINQINNLPLVEHKSTIKTDSSSSDQSKWDRFLADVKNNLLGMVQVSKLSNSTPLRVLPNDEILLRQSLKLDLLNARIAILERNNLVWHNSLNDVKSNIMNYFVASQKRDAILSILNSLLQINLGMEDANLDQTIKALNQLNAL